MTALAEERLVRPTEGGSGQMRVLVAAAASLQAESLAVALGVVATIDALAAGTVDAVRNAADQSCDAIVFLSQPRLDGHPPWTAIAGITADLAAREASIPIVAVAPSDAPEAVRLTLEAGARGFVSQSQPLTDITAALATVRARGTYLSPGHAISVASLDDGGANRLTDREIEVLHLLAMGSTNREAAERLHLSTRTVESHRANLRRKRGLVDHAAIVAEAIELGLIG